MDHSPPYQNEPFDDLKPSLFELLSEHQLASLIPPSLRYLLAVATHRHPRHLLPLLNAFDELYALGALLVERHYLRTHAATFTEHFYGLRRQRALALPVPRAQAGAPAIVREAASLTDCDVWRNLAVLVGVPYVRRKLDESYEIHAPRALLGQNYTRLPARPSFAQRFMHCYRWFLRHVYPSVNAAYCFAMLAFHLAYLFDNSHFHSPFLWLLGTRMRRLGEADYRAMALRNEKQKSQLAGNLSAGSVLDPRLLYTRALSSLRFVLPTSIFALKFLEWWHASDFARQLSRKATEGLELPPPVITGSLSRTAPLAGDDDNEAKSQAEDESRDDGLDEAPPIAASSLLPILVVSRAPRSRSELCPICGEEIRVATACQTGYVFCYSCIHRWVEGKHERQERFMAGKEGRWESGQGRCAVTGRRVLGGTEGLRRIMV